MSKLSKEKVKEDREKMKIEDPTDGEVHEVIGSSEELGEELLPGIPDNVTLDLITTQLSWRELHMLSSVSPDWEQALHSREIYNARVRSHTTETLVILDHKHSSHHEVCPLLIKAKTHVLSLYSPKERKILYDLPPIPGLRRGIPCHCRLVSLDGRVYLLGGAKEPTLHIGSREVYVLDLAGHMQWKRCADMGSQRLKFGSGVMNGKIYVFGGIDYCLPVLAPSAEVYEPKVDAWFPTTNMPLCGFDHTVVTVGEQLLVAGGRCYDQNICLRTSGWRRDHPLFGSKCTEDRCHCIEREQLRFMGNSIRPERVPQVYHPAKDEWIRLVEAGRNWKCWDKLFMAKGNLHSMSSLGIRVHDIEMQTWTMLHSFGGPSSAFYFYDTTLWPYERVEVTPIAIATTLVADGQLLMTANLYHRGRFGSCLLQSRGFGCQNKEILWEIAQCCLLCPEEAAPFGYNYSACTHFGYTTPIMCPIQL